MGDDDASAGKLITEIPLIRRYSHYNEDQDWRFRAHLKAGNVSNADLDQTVHDITNEVWSQIDCTKCANCCKVLEVVVDDKDILRLSRRLKLTAKEFEQRHVFQGQDKVKMLNKQPCFFLNSDNTCSVYEDRPTACHDFPYLHKTGFRQRSIMMVHNQEVCPIVFNVWQRLKLIFWPGYRPRKRRP